MCVQTDLNCPHETGHERSLCGPYHPHRDICLPIEHILVAIRHTQLQLDPRILTAELSQHVRKHVARNQLPGCDPHYTLLALHVCRRQTVDCRSSCEHCFSVRNNRKSDCGRYEATLRAHK